MKLLTWLGACVFLTQVIIFFLLIADDPFYGDAISSVSRAALNIYDSNFSNISYPTGYDPGHPLLIPLMYALSWKFIGLTLGVSHAINILFALGILVVVFRWASSENGVVEGFIAMVLLAVTPLFLAQSAMMNTHLPLTFFVLLAARSLVKDRMRAAALWMAIMMLVHLQAVFYWIGLLLWYLLIKEGGWRKLYRLLPGILLPVLVFGLWVVYHYQISGWTISSPDYAAHRGMPGMKGILKNLILADWRISDYGQIGLILPVLIIIVKFFKRNAYPAALTLFVIVYLFNALAISVTTHTGPAHRYFLPCLPFLVLAANDALRNYKPIWSIAVFVVVISGHWWFYPGKTMGDATLQYRESFALMESVCHATTGSDVYTFAPLGNSSRSMYLEDGVTCFASLYDTDLDTVAYVVHGNIVGDFSDSLFRLIDTGWYGNSFEGAHVYLSLYANPRFMTKAPQNWKVREKSKSEIWMEDLKRRLR